VHVWERRVEVAGAVRRFFNARATPLPLAVLRIAMFGYMATQMLPAEVRAYTDFDPILYSPLSSMRWVAAVFPVDTTTAQGMGVAYRVACIMAMLGIATRWSAAAAALLAIYILGLGHMTGKPTHMHHLVWFSALLAAAPSGGALSVDAWLAARRGRSVAHPSTLAAGLCVRVIWLLFGVIYFWPGFWKLWQWGINWLAPLNLGDILRHKWFELGEFVPPLPLDQYPLVLILGGIGTLLFELGFVALVMLAGARAWAVLVALGFHLSNLIFMGIPFEYLIVCFVIFVDWDALAARWGRGVPAAQPLPYREPARAVLIALATFLIIVNCVMGAGRWQWAWPFACYPTFSHIQGPIKTTIRLALLDDKGREVASVADQELMRHLGFQSSHFFGLVGSLARRQNTELRSERLRALLSALLARGLRPGGATLASFRFVHVNLRASEGEPSATEEDWGNLNLAEAAGRRLPNN